jgi:hypothetical protein
MSYLGPHIGPNHDTVARDTPPLPVVKRASTYSTSRAADSSGDSASVSSVSSGASGSSYGSDTPVKAWIFPARARS